ncbi:MAG: MFS transporter [Thermoplasmata archaeon]|nr:MFS transporter [Thermoplasmata archaeon]
MLDITRKGFVKYSLFASLYFSEGLMIAITTVVTSLYLRSKAVPIPITTLAVGAANIPWILKFVWGPIVDHFIKYGRRTFILFGGFLCVFSMFLASQIDPSAYLILFIFLIFLGHVGIGFIDVSTDALAVDISTDEDRGKINGSMFAGQYSAWALGSFLFPLIGSSHGYGYVYLLNGFIILAILIFPFLIREKIRYKTKQKIFTLVVREFKKRTTQLITVFSPLVFMNEGILSFIMPIYMRDFLDLKDVQIGMISMLLPMFLALGSIAGGAITDKIGRKKALYIFIILDAIFTASLIFTDNWWKLSLIYSIVGFLLGAHSTITCALFMDITNPRIGATQYGILTGIANIGLNGGGMISGSIAAIFSFAHVFLFASWTFGPTLLVLYLIRFKNKKKFK